MNSIVGSVMALVGSMLAMLVVSTLSLDFILECNDSDYNFMRVMPNKDGSLFFFLRDKVWMAFLRRYKLDLIVFHIKKYNIHIYFLYNIKYIF